MDPERLVFIDETWTSTSMTQVLRTCSEGPALHRFGAAWSLEDHDLRGRSAPQSIDRADGPMDGEMFLAYVRQFLCPTLQPGDIGVLDNLSSHKVSGVKQVIQATDATLLYLPPCSPDSNPIEKLFSKLKALLRKAAKRTIDALWTEIGNLLSTVTHNECANFFAACGYVST
jgi:transposase